MAEAIDLLPFNLPEGQFGNWKITPFLPRFALPGDLSVERSLLQNGYDSKGYADLLKIPESITAGKNIYLVMDAQVDKKLQPTPFYQDYLRDKFLRYVEDTLRANQATAISHNGLFKNREGWKKIRGLKNATVFNSRGMSGDALKEVERNSVLFTIDYQRAVRNLPIRRRAA